MAALSVASNMQTPAGDRRAHSAGLMDPFFVK